MLPDATLRGMRRFRSHGGIAPTVAGWSLSSEVSSPSSATPCQGRHAGRGADTPTSSVLSRRHRCHGDGISFWPIVCPALRVRPLNSQVAFALQLGDADLHAAQLRSFHGICLARSLPAAPSPLRARFVFTDPGLLAGSSRRETRLRSGLRSSNHTLWVTASAPGSKLPVCLTRFGRGF